MREVQEKKIGDNTYRVRPMGAREGRRVLARLAQVLGGGLAGIVSAANGGGKDAVFQGLESIAKNFTEEQIDYFCETFTPFTSVRKPDGKEPQLKDCFDDLFACNYWEMSQWLMFCLEVNFGSFLGGNGTLAGLFADQADQAK